MKLSVALPAALLLIGQASAFAQTPPSADTPASASTTMAAPADPGEPLPPGAPSEPYELSAWCYGALSEYLDIYDKVQPDLRAIDKMFGSSVKNEKQPYAEDIAAARVELTVLAGAVEAAEKASPSPIQDRGREAVKTGRAIWAPAEGKSERELARAWLTWGLPDKCDSTARQLAASSAVLGQALKYNAGQETPAPATNAAPAPSETPQPPN